jgi:triacylglycerol lipase
MLKRVIGAMLRSGNTLTTAGLLLLAASCSTLNTPAPSASNDYPPIVFVHGNGDTAAMWTTTIWRFESNGWPHDRMRAIDVPYPLALDEDDKPQAARSSAAENKQYLAGEVDRMLAATGARQVVLVGNSRGGNAIRDYIKNGGGAAKVSYAILGGTPNHGVWATDFRLANEFNGKGPFLTGLNAPQGPNGDEVTPGIKWMTLRSDSNDKYAQPDGRWIGQPNLATNVLPDGPALKGALNIVLPGVDHRETSYHPKSFEQTWKFITGTPPARIDIEPQATVVLNGKIAGLAGGAPTNTPLPGAMVQVYEVSPATGERWGMAVHAKVIGADGSWGPFQAKSSGCYEFVINAEGYAITHIYRSPFPRSSDIVNMRPIRIADADKSAASVVMMARPRGYFDVQRDRMSFDGKPLPGVPPGVAGVALSRLALGDDAPRSVVAEFNGERIVMRSWPIRDNHLAVAELHY